MDRRDEFQLLTEVWQQAKQATALAQMALDLKIKSFLVGFGEPPTIDEQNEVDNLRAHEAECRQEMDEFVWEAMQEAVPPIYQADGNAILPAPPSNNFLA